MILLGIKALVWLNGKPSTNQVLEIVTSRSEPPQKIEARPRRGLRIHLFTVTVFFLLEGETQCVREGR
jgi:hypothetical protein